MLFINSEHPAEARRAQRFAKHVEQVRVARQAGFGGVSIGQHLSHCAIADLAHDRIAR